MAVAWKLVPCLKALHGEFDKLAPKRDHASDGTIGDAAHAAGKSDHNPAPVTGLVHAIDVDDDLKKTGWTMARAVAIIVSRHRQGLDDRLQYIIYNRVIYSRSWGWTARAYLGTSPHTEHAHFSARYDKAREADARPWGLLAADTPLPAPGGKADIKKGSRVLREGMVGSDVAWVQRWLGVDPANGKFGAKTDLNVRRYQKMQGLTTDGVVGAKTWAKLLGKST